MKKKLLFTLFAIMVCISNAMAEDKITIPDVDVLPGEEALVAVNYDIDGTLDYLGFQITLNLPEGITCVGAYIAPELKEVVPELVVGKSNNDGETLFLAYQLALDIIPANLHTLMYFKIKADENIPLGTTFECVTNSVEFSLENSSRAVYFPNASFNINVKEPERRVLDEESTEIADGTNDLHLENEYIQVNRKIGANTWSTICLPFDMSAEQLNKAFGDDVILATFKDYTESERTRTINGIEVTNKVYTINFESANLTEGLKANTPYIIKVSNDIENFKLDKIVVTPDEDEAATYYRTGTPKQPVWRGTMQGILSKRVIPNHALFISNNTLYSSKNTTMKAYRCWIELDVWESLSESGSNITFMVDGEPTSIEGLTVNGKEIVDGQVYTLSGVNLGKAQDLQGKLPRGIYIVNNKKVIVK